MKNKKQITEVVEVSFRVKHKGHVYTVNFRGGDMPRHVWCISVVNEYGEGVHDIQSDGIAPSITFSKRLVVENQGLPF